MAKLSTFNPVREALSDARHIRKLSMLKTRWCCKCNADRPVFGGKFPNGGRVRTGPEKFICKACLENRT